MNYLGDPREKYIYEFSLHEDFDAAIKDLGLDGVLYKRDANTSPAHKSDQKYQLIGLVRRGAFFSVVLF